MRIDIHRSSPPYTSVGWRSAVLFVFLISMVLFTNRSLARCRFFHFGDISFLTAHSVSCFSKHIGPLNLALHSYPLHYRNPASPARSSIKLFFVQFRPAGNPPPTRLVPPAGASLEAAPSSTAPPPFRTLQSINGTPSTSAGHQGATRFCRSSNSSAGQPSPVAASNLGSSGHKLCRSLSTNHAEPPSIGNPPRYILP